MALAGNIVHSAQVFLDGQVDEIANIRILANPALEDTADNLAHEFDGHPTPRIVNGADVLRDGTRANFGYDAQQVLITLWDSYETANLPDSVRLTVDDGQTGCD